MNFVIATHFFHRERKQMIPDESWIYEKFIKFYVKLFGGFGIGRHFHQVNLDNANVYVLTTDKNFDLDS